MGIEGEDRSHQSQITSKNEVKQTHHYVFPVNVRLHLRDTDFDNGYEWVNTGNGKWVRVRKKLGVDLESHDRV